MPGKLNINESFICKIWEGGGKYFDNLRTSDDEEVEILNYGAKNYDAGPDYKNAKIKISDRILLGDIEIHRDFNSWIQHKHRRDRNYNSVVLQVVLWNSGNDGNPKVKGSRVIPTVILSKYLNNSINRIWQEIIFDPDIKFTLPCSEFSHLIPDDRLKHFLNKLSLERLSLKSKRMKERIEELIFQDRGDLKYELAINKSRYWKQIFYEFVFEALGFSKNKEPMLKLTQKLYLRNIYRVIHDSDNKLFSIQALLFGHAGFLNEIKSRSGYAYELKKLWFTYCDMTKSVTREKYDWKFFRLRPSNFPTIRLAYGSFIVQRLLFDDLFRQVIKPFKKHDFIVKNCELDIRSFFSAGEDEYWRCHFGFKEGQGKEINMIGKERIDDIITNVVIPFVYLYSQIFKDEMIRSNVIKLFTSHRISSSFRSRSVLRIMNEQLLAPKGVIIKTPAIEQAVMQLYNFYCTRERCGECPLGTVLLKERAYDYRIIFY